MDMGSETAGGAGPKIPEAGIHIEFPREKLQSASRRLMDELENRNDPQNPTIVVFNPLDKAASQNQQTQEDNRIILFTKPPTEGGFYIILTDKGFYEIATADKSRGNNAMVVNTMTINSTEQVIKQASLTSTKGLKAEIKSGALNIEMTLQDDIPKMAVLEFQNEGNPITDDTLPQKALEASKKAAEQGYETALKPVDSMLEFLKQSLARPTISPPAGPPAGSQPQP